jgi:3-dehydrosphinganine reductase
MAKDMTANNKSQKFLGQVAFICGGSKGIGKETAKEFFRLGGSVCLLARDQKYLDMAIIEVENLRSNQDQFVETISGDATKREEIEPAIDKFMSRHGVPEYLINAVGYAYPEYIQNFNLDDFKENMEINYFGQLVPTLVFLPHFIEQKRGHISFVSSMMGYMGIIGYATYAPTKFALVGLAEVLRHELHSYNISISILYPPDTETPGFKRENETKPPETAILSSTAKLFKPDKVAKQYLQGISKGKFYIMFGEGIWIWRLFRLFPWLVHSFIDNDLRKARKKLRQN